MPADVINLGPPTDQRPKEERAFEAAIAALRGVTVARDTAVRALDELAQALVWEGETVETTLALPLNEALQRHHAVTLALWQHIDHLKTEHLCNEDFDAFDELTRNEVPQLEEEWTAWKRWNWPGEGDDG
jgi:hypothetical protein